jgi:hypothetical protein
MYACFENIPREIRQRAFDAIIAAGEPNNSNNGLSWTGRLIYDGHVCCPWGIVNCIIEPRKSVDGSNEKYVPSAVGESVFLYCRLGLSVQPEYLRIFMEAADDGKLSDPKKLATAMGVKYTPVEGK